MKTSHKRAFGAALALTLGSALLGTAARPSQAPISVTPYPPLDADQAAEVRAALGAMKRDPRGPYQRILWFCEDGTRVPPREGNCDGRGGGRQHAELSPTARRLGELGFHPGTIIAALSYEDFVDVGRGHDRLRELVLDAYLIESDDGWVLRRARYYRGARQIEDEERRGREHLERLLADAEWRRSHALLTTLLVAAVPHGQAGVPGARIRQLAEDMAAAEPRLQELRIKIHSRPGPDDLRAIERFRRANAGTTAPELDRILSDLTDELTALYTTTLDANRWNALRTTLAGLPRMQERMTAAATALSDHEAIRAHIRELAATLRLARDLLMGDELVSDGRSGRLSLALLDTIHYADAMLRSVTNRWIAATLGPRSEAGISEPVTRRAILGVAYDLIDAAYGTGWLTVQEHRALTRDRLDVGEDPEANVYRRQVQYLGNATTWAQSLLHQAFALVLGRYRDVEPGVARFEDALLRGSVLLALANVLDPLARDADRAVGMTHSVFDLELPGRLSGLNPGVAVGTLHVVTDHADLVDLDPEGIYVIPETFAELGRVAGILTLQEGSRLSHVQLLARSLGIPNAVVSAQLLDALRQREGQPVFYAVSNLGTVVLKERSTMGALDLELVQEQAAAPVDSIVLDEAKLDLTVRRVLRLDEVDLGDSGRTVGPKAANLGRLRRYFPERVSPGLVVPFGVFRAHIERDLLGTGRTLADDLAILYDSAEEMRRAGVREGDVQARILGRLRDVREAIRSMELLPSFEEELRAALRRELGPEGTYGVFVRSDTNVEDLPNFTGAGLNLTVMNQIEDEHVLRAIRDVWASPFSERSYTWRQQLLENPAHVYPSLVLLRSVPVDASGVLVTRDLSEDRPGWWTVTVSPGIGGVVDGEPAETVLVPDDGGEPILLSSARAVWQKVLLMTSGGIGRAPVVGAATLLTPARLADLQAIVRSIEERYEPVVEPDGTTAPWDIEFGFLGDRTQLFQIRPLVTNRRVRMLHALTAIDGALLSATHEIVALDEAPEER